MAQWAVVIPAERYEQERLFQHDTLAVDGLAVDGPDAARLPAPGDEVLVVVGADQPLLVAVGRVPRDGGRSDGVGRSAGALLVAYTRRLFDAPQPATGLALDGPLNPVDAATFRAVLARLDPPADRRTWLVSLDLPIEADTPAEAVRLFWSYVTELGPAELPAFVSPSGDELAMQAFVLGEQAQLDPEDDD